jgi:hypothetical protein
MVNVFSLHAFGRQALRETTRAAIGVFGHGDRVTVRCRLGPIGSAPLSIKVVDKGGASFAPDRDECGSNGTKSTPSTNWLRNSPPRSAAFARYCAERAPCPATSVPSSKFCARTIAPFTCCFADKQCRELFPQLRSGYRSRRLSGDYRGRPRSSMMRDLPRRGKSERSECVFATSPKRRESLLAARRGVRYRGR